MNPIQAQIIPQPIWCQDNHIISYLIDSILVLVPLLNFMRQLTHLVRFIEADHLWLNHLYLLLSEKPVYWVTDVVRFEAPGLWVEG